MGIKPVVWIIWAAVGTILAILLIYRGTLLENEDDQIYLDANGENQQQEQTALINRAKKLQPYIYTAIVATCLIGLAILAYIVMDAMRNFR